MSMHIITKNVDKLFSERIKRGMTLKDTATACKVSERAIRKFEEGLCYPTKSTYNRMANVFGWEVWE